MLIIIFTGKIGFLDNVLLLKFLTSVRYLSWNIKILLNIIFLDVLKPFCRRLFVAMFLLQLFCHNELTASLLTKIYKTDKTRGGTIVAK
jgi:hypothetical protein